MLPLNKHGWDVYYNPWQILRYWTHRGDETYFCAYAFVLTPVTTTAVWGAFHFKHFFPLLLVRSTKWRFFLFVILMLQVTEQAFWLPSLYVLFLFAVCRDHAYKAARFCLWVDCCFEQKKKKSNHPIIPGDVTEIIQHLFVGLPVINFIKGYSASVCCHN